MAEETKDLTVEETPATQEENDEAVESTEDNELLFNPVAADDALAGIIGATLEPETPPEDDAEPEDGEDEEAEETEGVDAIYTELLKRHGNDPGKLAKSLYHAQRKISEQGSELGTLRKSAPPAGTEKAQPIPQDGINIFAEEENPLEQIEKETTYGLDEFYAEYRQNPVEMLDKDSPGTEVHTRWLRANRGEADRSALRILKRTSANNSVNVAERLFKEKYPEYAKDYKKLLNHIASKGPDPEVLFGMLDAHMQKRGVKPVKSNRSVIPGPPVNKPKVKKRGPGSIMNTPGAREIIRKVSGAEHDFMEAGLL